MNNVGIRFGAAIIGLACFFTYDAFFVIESEARNFNDDVVDMVEASDQRFEQAVGMLEDYRGGAPIDVEEFESISRQLAKDVQTDLHELKSMPIPDDDLCREFHAAAVGYVANSHIYAVRYEDVIEYVRSHHPSTSDADGDAIDEIFAACEEKDSERFEKLSEVQERLADKFGFELQ